jgi:hypothetical protein
LTFTTMEGIRTVLPGLVVPRWGGCSEGEGGALWVEAPQEVSGTEASVKLTVPPEWTGAAGRQGWPNGWAPGEVLESAEALEWEPV